MRWFARLVVHVTSLLLLILSLCTWIGKWDGHTSDDDGSDDEVGDVRRSGEGEGYGGWVESVGCRYKYDYADADDDYGEDSGSGVHGTHGKI